VAHHSGNALYFYFVSQVSVYTLPLYLLTLRLQATQLAYIIEDRLKEVAKDVDRERALKDIAVATAKYKDKATEDSEKRAREAERAWALAEQSLTEMGEKLGGMELELAETESLNLAQANKIVELKAALEAAKDKWYNVGFTSAENSVEPIIY